MSKKYLMGIDAGSTSIKIVLFDENGIEISSACSSSIRSKSKSKSKGFQEFDIDNLWYITSSCIKKVLKESKITASDVAGIGACSFGNGLVFLDDSNQVIAPGAFSQDYRANEIVDLYSKDGTLAKISEITKAAVWAGQPGPILRWYKEHEPEIYSKIGHVMLFKDFINYKLTGIFSTDANICGGSNLMNLSTFEYSKELMDLYGIPEIYDKLPILALSPEEVVGTVTSKASEDTGLQIGTPVVAGMMDILASLVGGGATDEGIITMIAGTWCINETHSDKIIPNASANMPFIEKGKYLNCSYTGASACNYEWFINVLGGTAKLEASQCNKSYFKILDELISSTPIEDSKVIFHPFIAQPSIHPEAKANFFNIDQNTTYSEMVYALAEGVAFIHRYHIKFLLDSGLPATKIRLSGGIARSKVWAQIFANVLELPVEVVDCDEVGAHGVAIAAGVGTGIYSSYNDAFKNSVKILATYTPDPSTYKVYASKYNKWLRLTELIKVFWDEAI